MTVISVIVSVSPPSPQGLQLKLDSQDCPFVSFTYVLSPLTDKLTPVDWKLLVTEDIEHPHIRCHVLQAGDNLPQLIIGFRKVQALAVVLINTSDNYSLHPTFLSGTQVGHYPVLLLTKGDGMKLLKTVEQSEINVLARIGVENFSMPVGVLQETEDRIAHINSDQTAAEKPGQCVINNGCRVCSQHLLDIVGVSMSEYKYSSYQFWPTIHEN